MLKYLLYIIFLILLYWMDLILIEFLVVLLSFMFLMELNSFNFFENLSFKMGLDLMSFLLIKLSFWICMLMLISSESIYYYNYYKDKFSLILLILMLFLYLSFSSLNMFMYYLYFESSLIPTFMIIMGWGYQSERIQAGVYMLMYTLLASLPLLLMLFYLYYNLYTFNYYMFNMNFDYNFVMMLGFYLAFMVKLPMFMVHLWLPKAHVEAPVAGSMILAGVLLKLGGYGVIRISFMLMKHIMNYGIFFIILSLIGGIIISLNCLRQSDMKLLIAYSSVGHMGIMLGGLMTFSYWGMMMGVLMMVAHGLCSSGLFFLVNSSYERISSRSLLLTKGLLHILPKMSLWWFLFCIMNMAAPPSLNLVSEIGLINSLISWSGYSMIPLCLMSFFSAAYSLYLFSYSQHGKFSFNIYSFYINNVREYIIMLMHWVPLNFFVLNLNVMLYWI